MAIKKKEPAEPKKKTAEISRKNYEEIRSGLKYADNTMDEIGVICTIEYLTPDERILFVNELHRVLKPDGKASIITPYWCSNRAYGDLNFQWPPVSESWYFNLNAEWRKLNNPSETRYTCDFDSTWGYGMHPLLHGRNQAFQEDAITFHKEAAQDMIASLIKR